MGRAFRTSRVKEFTRGSIKGDAYGGQVIRPQIPVHGFNVSCVVCVARIRRIVNVMVENFQKRWILIDSMGVTEYTVHVQQC